MDRLGSLFSLPQRVTILWNLMKGGSPTEIRDVAAVTDPARPAQAEPWGTLQSR